MQFRLFAAALDSVLEWSPGAAVTHVSTLLERVGVGVSSAFSLGLLWVGATTPSFVQSPGVQAVVDYVPAPRFDYTIIAAAVLSIGMNLATVITSMYRQVREVRDKSIAGQLTTALARIDSLEREHASEVKHLKELFGAEVEHRDRMAEAKDRDYEHAKKVRENASALLQTELDRVDSANQILTATLVELRKSHTETESELRRMLNEATRQMGSSLIQSTQNTGKLLNGVLAGVPGPAGADGEKGERGEKGDHGQAESPHRGRPGEPRPDRD